MKRFLYSRWTTAMENSLTFWYHRTFAATQSSELLTKFSQFSTMLLTSSQDRELTSSRKRTCRLLRSDCWWSLWHNAWSTIKWPKEMRRTTSKSFLKTESSSNWWSNKDWRPISFITFCTRCAWETMTQLSRREYHVSEHIWQASAATATLRSYSQCTDVEKFLNASADSAPSLVEFIAWGEPSVTLKLLSLTRNKSFSWSLGNRTLQRRNWFMDLAATCLTPKYLTSSYHAES